LRKIKIPNQKFKRSNHSTIVISGFKEQLTNYRELWEETKKKLISLSDEEVYELNWDSFNYDEIFLSSTYKVWRNIREYSLYYSVLIISATMIRMEINE
jgi:hypothetical protein